MRCREKEPRDGNPKRLPSYPILPLVPVVLGNHSISSRRRTALRVAKKVESAGGGKARLPTSSSSCLLCDMQETESGGQMRLMRGRGCRFLKRFQHCPHCQDKGRGKENREAKDARSSKGKAKKARLSVACLGLDIFLFSCARARIGKAKVVTGRPEIVQAAHCELDSRSCRVLAPLFLLKGYEESGKIHMPSSCQNPQSKRL